MTQDNMLENIEEEVTEEFNEENINNKKREEEEMVEATTQDNQEDKNLQQKLKTKTKRFCATIKDKNVEQKLKIIQLIAKNRNKSTVETNNEILEKGITLLYVSKDLKALIGEEEYQKLINKSPLDIDL